MAMTLGYWQFSRVESPPETPTTVSSSPTQSIPYISTTNNSSLLDIPAQKTLSNNYHIFQTFNNCGPAALSMALSYYGINKSQQELGQSLRPYQNPKGDNDDKSVTLPEIAKKAEESGLLAYNRPNGDINKVKQFIAIDVPVIARTNLKKTEDIGHYRVIKGYDDNSKEIIQDDSLQGKNLKYSYDDFNNLWLNFNYEYLVLVPKEKQQQAERILGEDLDPEVAWNKSVSSLEYELENDPDNVTTLFNLSIAYHNTSEYQKSIQAFEKVENKLTARALWYQIEPIYSYYEVGNYDRVMQITERVLNNNNRAFSELYILRAQVYLKQGDEQKAAEQLAQAKLYNQNIEIDPELLSQIN